MSLAAILFSSILGVAAAASDKVAVAWIGLYLVKLLRVKLLCILPHVQHQP